MDNEVARRGFRPAPPVFWGVAAREAASAIEGAHRAYAEAGVDIVCALTGETTVRGLGRGGVSMRAAALTHRAVDVALEATTSPNHSIAVAGVLASLTEPGGSRLPARALATEHIEHARRLASAGCHLVLVEGMASVRESLSAVAAARASLGITVCILKTCDGATLADDTDTEEAADLVIAVGASAVVVEAPLERVGDAFATLHAAHLGVPIGARAIDETRAGDERFVDVMTDLIVRGATIVGGGAGVSLDAIAALCARVRARAAA